MLGVLGGVGLAAFPFKYIKKFIDRPKRPLTKSEYLRLVRDLSERAQSVREKCLAAKDEEGKVPKRQTAQIGKKLRR